MTYVCNGMVPKKSCIPKIAQYLMGVAHNFYISKVADDARNWRMKKFFTELYNHCFPLTYRLDQRQKLQRAYQYNKTVCQFTMELAELFNTIGIMDKHEKVHKLWTSLNASIQQGLRREKLTPETALYSQVKQTAELVEMIDNIGCPAKKDNLPKKTESTPHVSMRTDTHRKDPNINVSSSSNRHEGLHHNRRNHTSSQHQASGLCPSGLSRPTNPPRPPNTAPQRPKCVELSDKQRDEYRAKGQCFRCGGTGHILAQCPDGKSVTGNSNSPPGL